ncbi:hypothetical protein [Streptomyces sp. HC307]|uniref:hypothetical protein n=1 Tax=Streptomyces flavusporus TaxID=3385496 RepID=UPI003917599E
MNRSGIRRSRFRAGALAASALVSVAVLTGCGGSGDGDFAVDASVSPSAAQTSAAASAVKPLTAAQLDKLSLAASDLKGFDVRKPAAYERFTKDDLRTGEADCAPVSQVMWGVALGDPAATAQRRVDSGLDDTAIDAAESAEELDAAFTVTSTTVSLASYDNEDQAKTALKSLRSSIAACDGGFQSSAGGTQDVGKVSTATAPDAGDEAVAFTATVSGDGGLLGPTKAVIFRRGSILAQFSTVNSAAVVSGDAWDFPTVLVETQETKLG